MENRLYSAVVDSRPEFVNEAKRLVWSLINEAQVALEQIVIHSVYPIHKMQYFTSMGIKVVEIKPFLNNPWCNKLQQLDYLIKEDFIDVVLLDTDVLVLKEPPRANKGSVHAKLVDFSNPPIEILKKIYDDANLPWIDAQADIDNAPTVYANANGGVYVIDRNCLLKISDRWQHWANWLMERKAWFGPFWWHIDQISFAMAVAETNVLFEQLDRCYNFPTQEHNQSIHLDRIPAILHYHRCINSDGTLKTVDGLIKVNSEIMRINSKLINKDKISI